MKISSLRPALLLAAFLFSTCYLFSQKYSFDDVLTVTLNSTGEIYNESGVTGYYSFYEVDKVDRKNKRYTLELLDQNLNKIARKPITDTKYTTLKEAVYNGKSLMLKFHDIKEKKYTLRQYDVTTGDKISSKIIEPGRYDYQMGGNESTTSAGAPTLFAVPGKGFLNFSVDTRKGAMSKTYYSITYIPNNKEEKGWKVSSSEKSKEYEMATFLAVNENILMVTLIKRSGLMSRDLNMSVMGIDIASGKKLFNKKIEDSKYDVQVNSGKLTGDDIQLYGLYFPRGSKNAKDKSLGLCSYSLNKSGEIVNKKYISWARDVSKHIASSAKGKIEDVGYLYFHTFLKLENGDVLGVAESFRKAASGAGIAMAALGGRGTSLVKMVIEDFYLFRFGSDFSLKSVEVVEKDKSSWEMPSGFEFLGPQMSAHYVKYLGGFDYLFTQSDKDRSLFNICYTDYVRVKGEKNKNIFGSINYADGDLSVDKMEFNSDATTSMIMRGKPGYVLVYEYFKKQKKLDMRLEKLNF